jgi:hypothetical protein
MGENQPLQNAAIPNDLLMPNRSAARRPPSLLLPRYSQVGSGRDKPEI